MGTEASFLKPVLTNSQLLQKHIQYTLLCMLGLAQSSEGWTWYVKRVLCPGIRGLEQESFITHTDDLCLILASPLCTFYLAQPLLTSLYHLFLFRPNSNLSVEGDQVMGQPS